MLKNKIQILSLLVLLLVPSLVFGQKAAANKSWSNFWNQFTSAVNKKSRTGVKALMCVEKDFLNGGGIETRDEWLAAVQKEKLWGELQRAVAKGTTDYDLGGGKPARVTGDRSLIFEFTGGRWRFRGLMGD